MANSAGCEPVNEKIRLADSHPALFGLLGLWAKKSSKLF